MAILSTNTKYGPVSGVKQDTCVVYKGIPYAKPPVGELRFMPPVEPDAWTEERKCDKFGDGTISAMRRGDLPMSEDCLYLNVWTPAETKEDKLAVMVWIYGGGFQDGNSASPEFDGTKLAEQGVVVVNFNYRCGVLGFLAHPALDKRSETGTSGNYGILDQIAALKWVQENIEAFGGDPSRVMIHGQSAGGISCRIHLTSPLSQGLFKRAAVQSGGGLNEADPVRPISELEDIAIKAMEKLGWTEEDLFTRSGEELTSELNAAAKTLFARRVIGVFQPCVDNYVITDVPGVHIANGNYSEDIDVICGTVCGDSWMFCREVCDDFGTNDDLYRAFSYSPSQAWADTTVKTGRKSIHTYYLERTQPVKHPGMGGDGIYRYGLTCPHSSEIAYVFSNLDKKRGSEGYTEYDWEIASLMTRYWANFAKTGDPNGEGLPVWSEYTAETPVSLHISDEGYCVENLVTTEIGRKVIEYTEEHPGMLESAEGLDY